MAYDDTLVRRLRRTLANEQVVERKMFGGLTFVVSGHMCCGVQDGRIMVRVGPDARVCDI
jgi:TfoX/Sxy family transcriptional regulator of competence genes